MLELTARSTPLALAARRYDRDGWMDGLGFGLHVGLLYLPFNLKCQPKQEESPGRTWTLRGVVSRGRSKADWVTNV